MDGSRDWDEAPAPAMSAELEEQQQRQQQEQQQWQYQIQAQQQQQATLAYCRQLQQTAQQQAQEAAVWRARAEAAEDTLHAIAPLVRVSGSTSEAMLERLAQARSLADLSDLSRMAFELRTTMISAEEHMAVGGGRASPPLSHPEKRANQPQHGRRAPPTQRAAEGGGGSGAAATPRPGAAARAAPPESRERQQPAAPSLIGRQRGGSSNSRGGGGSSTTTAAPAQTAQEFAPLLPYPPGFGGYQMVPWPAPFLQPVQSWINAPPHGQFHPPPPAPQHGAPQR